MAMTSGAAAHVPTRPVPTGSLVDGSFGSMWVDRGVPGRRGVLLACLAVGVFAGLTLPFTNPGLAFALVLVASGVVVLAVSPTRGEWFTWAGAALCVGFALMVVLRDAEWIVVLGLMASGLLVTAAVTRASTVPGMLLASIAWPLAGLRGIPWLGRTLRTFGAGQRSPAVVRTALLSAIAVLVFGALFASADAIFGSWVGAVVPDIDDSVLLRVFVTVAIGGAVLAASYLALNPPTVDHRSPRRPVQHRFEWLAPVLLVDVVFLIFLAAQAAAIFGGHDYVQRVTGLTYADYVHQGFAQLTIATALTLLVVWAAARKAGTSASDTWWLRGSLGVLCLLTLVVVGSALHRMDLYQQAYGFTRLRLLVDAFEGWLGLVVVGVLVAGISLKGAWLPRAALLSGAAVLLGLAVANPDAWIARHNIDRYATTGKVDWTYLQGLSADATPTLAELPASQAACALGTEVPEADPLAGWNLSRDRARDLLLEKQFQTATCP